MALAYLYATCLAGDLSHKVSCVRVLKGYLLWVSTIHYNLPQHRAMLSNLLSELSSINACTQHKELNQS